MKGQVSPQLGLIIGLFFAILAYLYIGLPLLEQLTATNGILTSYPVFVALTMVLLYAGAVGVFRSRRAFVIFLIVFVVQDILEPPMMIPMSGAVPLTAGQQMAGDVYFYFLFSGFGLPHGASWMLAYFAVPMLLLMALVMELRLRSFSSLVPVVF
jgi:hypothetical protein